MASAVYPTAKNSFLSQNPSIDLDTDTIKVMLVNISSDYTYSSAHQYLSSANTYRYGTTADQTLTSKTVTLGVFDAADVTWTAVSISGGKTIGAAIIYKEIIGSPSTSPLIAYIEFSSAVTPNGGDISIAWDNGANKIFALN